MQIKPINVTEKTIEELKLIWRRKTPMVGIKTLLTHENEHFDEIVTQLIFKRYGKKIFPECDQIPVAFSNNEDVQKAMAGKDPDTFWRMLQMGFLCFGLAGGPLDEHDKPGSNECAATLMAKYLGVNKNPELSRILTYALFTDKNGDTMWSNEGIPAEYKDKPEEYKEIRNAFQALLPAKTVKNLWMVAGERKWSMEKINHAIDSLITLLDIEIEAQVIFNDVLQDLAQNPHKTKVISLNKYATALFVEHTSSIAGMAARAFLRDKLDGRAVSLTIIANPSTNLFVLLKSNKNSGDLRPTVSILRTMVAEKRGLTLKPEDLTSNGTVDGIPIYLHPEQGNVFNGSKSHQIEDGLYKKDLSKYQIMDAVYYGFGKKFHTEHKDNCYKGICAGDKCPLFSLGLTQCQKVKQNS